VIVDIHGHYTTAPPALAAWREAQGAGRRTELRISDDEIRQSLEANQIRLQRERGTDVTFFSPRFAGVCQLPQSPGIEPKNCIAELERCVRELGFIGCNLNPDPTSSSIRACITRPGSTCC